MKILEITDKTKTHQVLLDDEDYNWVLELHNEVKFRIKQGYVCRQKEYCSHKKRRSPLLVSQRIHRLIAQQFLGLGINDRRQVDHIDRNRLNNQRSNLRLSTNAENSKNKPGLVSRFTGVGYAPKRNKPWYARISVKSKYIFIGYFITELEAAQAYTQSVKMIWDEGSYECKSRVTLNEKLFQEKNDANR